MSHFQYDIYTTFVEILFEYLNSMFQYEICGVRQHKATNYMLYLNLIWCFYYLSDRPWSSPDRCVVSSRERIVWWDYKCSNKKALTICERPAAEGNIYNIYWQFNDWSGMYNVKTFKNNIYECLILKYIFAMSFYQVLIQHTLR